MGRPGSLEALGGLEVLGGLEGRVRDNVWIGELGTKIQYFGIVINSVDNQRAGESRFYCQEGWNPLMSWGWI